MRLIRTFALSCAASVFCLGLAVAQPAPARPAPAPAPSSAYEPKSGQPGKDVVWVPTHQALVDRMLDMAEVTPADYLVDLGSGDGRTVITAAKRGVRALGIEYNPDLVALSTRAAEKEGVADKARFIQADIFASDFKDATVVTLFLLPELNVRLRPTILAMKPGTRVVSNSFDMDEWTPDLTIDAGGECRISAAPINGSSRPRSPASGGCPMASSTSSNPSRCWPAICGSAAARSRSRRPR